MTTVQKPKEPSAVFKLAIKAIKLGDVRELIKLLEKNPGLVDEQDKYHRSLLHFAVYYHQYLCVWWLLANWSRSDGNLDVDDLTPLDVALIEGYHDIALLLLDEEGVSDRKSVV